MLKKGHVNLQKDWRGRPENIAKTETILKQCNVAILVRSSLLISMMIDDGRAIPYKEDDAGNSVDQANLFILGTFWDAQQKETMWQC